MQRRSFRNMCQGRWTSTLTDRCVMDGQGSALMLCPAERAFRRWWQAQSRQTLISLSFWQSTRRPAGRGVQRAQPAIGTDDQQLPLASAYSLTYLDLNFERTISQQHHKGAVIREFQCHPFSCCFTAGISETQRGFLFAACLFLTFLRILRNYVQSRW